MISFRFFHVGCTPSPSTKAQKATGERVWPWPSSELKVRPQGLLQRYYAQTGDLVNRACVRREFLINFLSSADVESTTIRQLKEAKCKGLAALGSD